MTTVAAALDRIARQVSVEVPDNWITASDLEHVELRDDFLPEVVDEILDRLDLPSPIGKQVVITGTGAESYDLPSDFLRLQRDALAVYESTTIRRALYPVSDDGVWTHLKSIGSTGADRYYRVQGYEGNWTISFYREPASSISVTVSYVSTLWMADSSGALGSAFTDVGDVLLLPRKVIEAGVVALWRERNGLPYDAKRAEYESEIARLSNDRRQRRIVRFGEKAQGRWPFDIPVPDEIPTS